MNTCSIQPGLCASHIESAVRAVMPQVDDKTLFRWAKRGVLPKYLIERANRLRLDNAKAKILRDIGAPAAHRIKAPVHITLTRVPLSRLTVTQREARHSIVESLAKDVRRGKAITKDSPLLVSYGPRGTFKVIDGHHRFLAHKLASARSERAPKSVHAFLIHLPHTEAMRAAWAASTETHNF